MSYAVYRRNSILLDLTIKDDDGSAVDITGCEIFFMVGNSIEKTIGDGITVINSATGKIEVHLTADDTNIPTRNYTCEVLVIDPAGNRWSSTLTGFLVKTNLSYQIE